MSMPGPVLVLGYGNTLRGDDGAGPKLVGEVEALGLVGVRTLACDLLTPELAEPVSRAATVVFVDAAVDTPRKVRLRPLRAARSSQVMAHACDPGTILALARDVFGAEPRALWLTIPARSLDLSDQLSPSARRGCSVALERLRKLLSENSNTGRRSARGRKKAPAKAR
jgi:hydrogenase maturation protease